MGKRLKQSADLFFRYADASILNFKLDLLSIAIALVPEGSTITVSVKDSSDEIRFDIKCIRTDFAQETFNRLEHLTADEHQTPELIFCRKVVHAHGGWISHLGFDQVIGIQVSIPYRIFYSYHELEVREKEKQRDSQT